jgi:hypothetical protein
MMDQYQTSTISLLCIALVLFLNALGDPLEYKTVIAGTLSNSTSVRGGGTGSIVCPMGSSVDTNLSFVAISSNSFNNRTITGNWTFYSFDSNGPGDIVQGVLYSGNIGASGYELDGETLDQQDRIMLCEPPLFGPVTISGTCGRDIEIMVGFQSDDPFQEDNSFNGSSDCQLIDQQ